MFFGLEINGASLIMQKDKQGQVGDWLLSAFVFFVYLQKFFLVFLSNQTCEKMVLMWRCYEMLSFYDAFHGNCYVMFCCSSWGRLGPRSWEELQKAY